MTALASLPIDTGRWLTAGELILAYLQEHSEITNGQARALTDIASDVDIKKVFLPAAGSGSDSAGGRPPGQRRGLAADKGVTIGEPSLPTSRQSAGRNAE